MVDKLRFHPSEYLVDWQEGARISIDELASATGIPKAELQTFLKGKSKVSKDIAERLSKVTGISSVTWLNLQDNYDDKGRYIYGL